jgi:hypothetical protein
MKISTNTAKTTAIIAVILLMASVALIAIPAKTVQAQLVGEIGTTPSAGWNYPNLGPLPTGVTPKATFETVAYMSITPNPIGIGQQILVNVWTSPGTTTYFYMQGYKVTIQKPDGTTEVIGPFNSYLADCSAWFQYKVNQIGTWKFKFEHPGTYIPAGNYTTRPQTDSSLPPGVVKIEGQPMPFVNITLWSSLYYAASSTDWQELTVQADMVMSWPSVPLPTDYWTRPISVENRDWWPISGNYPFSGAYYYANGRVLYSSNYKYSAYVQAPNTAHVVWRREGSVSGLIGGENYQNAIVSATYQPSSSADTPRIIYAGRCYGTLTKQMLTLINGTYRMQPVPVWECYDLRTGQVYWDLTDVIAPTNILYEDFTGTGVIGSKATSGKVVYLVAISGGRLYKYWPYTGAVMLNISLPSYITAGTIYNNEWVYSVQTINATQGNYRLINWTMVGSTTNFTLRIGSNITWPRSTIGNAIDYDAGIAIQGSACLAQPAGYTGMLDRGASTYNIGYNITAVDLKTGAVSYALSVNDTSVGEPLGGSTWVCDRGRVAASFGRHWVCWDARTGKQLWQSESADYPWGVFWAYTVASYDFNESKGAIIGCSYDGVYAFDWDNGKILWRYSSPMPPFEDPYGNEPFFGGVALADGKVFAYGGEHSPSYPITRGWHLHCINATTGELVWKITGIMSPAAVADGYLTGGNMYDAYLYVFGKGESTTTVAESPKTIAKGAQVLIEGTVMDMSPGDQGSTTNPTARLDSPTKPGTVPCVSAASMETQMEYLYMQHPIDGLYHNETITGVPVTLTAIKSDGSVIDIGKTTTNGYYGTFSQAWTPPDEGTYQILASFAGDDSYGSSSAATAVTVGLAPAETVAPVITTTAQDNMPLYGATAAIIVAIAVVGILVLRKK